MSKTARFSFAKGVNVVGDKAIMEEGFATVLDNVDLRSGSPRPIAAPQYEFYAPTGTTRSWSYRGRWFHSANWRDYVGEYLGGIERVYATEEGKYPTKTIGGVTALMGTQRPLTVLSVVGQGSLSPGGLKATIDYLASGNLADGERIYRISAKTEDGIQPPSAPVSVTIKNPIPVAPPFDPLADPLATPPATPTVGPAVASVTLTWGMVEKATGYVVWEGTQAGQLRLVDIPSSTPGFTDTGSLTASGDNASAFLQEQVFEYAYTYKRNVNGVYDESGLSSLSIPMGAATGRLVTRDWKNDGYWDQKQSDSVTNAAITASVGSIAATSAVSYLPLILSTAHVSTVLATDLVFGKTYTILTVGTTDFTLTGASANTVGIVFVATRVGIGTGTVTNPIYSFNSITNIMKINYVGHGFATDDKILFTGSVDPSWANKTYPIIKIDADNFGVKGIAKPSDALTLVTAVAQLVRAIVSSYTAAAAVATGDIVYLVGTGTGQTAISGLFKATYISATSFSVPLLATQTSGAITLSLLKWIPKNGYYDKWLIYRNEGGIWNLVEELGLEVTSYVDAKPYISLGGEPTSFYNDNGTTIDYETPPHGLTSIESHYGMKFGISGHTVRWTPPLVTDAWPEVFSVTLPYQPVGLASFGQGLVILCEDALYRLDGNTPTGMSLSKTYAEDGCFAPHSIQKTDRGLVYLSKRGIMLFDGTHAECNTDTRIQGYTLTAPSRLVTPYPFWWMPTMMTRNYADMAGEDSIKGIQYSFTLDNTQTIDGYNKDIKSFYHQGKYYLFYTGVNYAANTAFCVDFQLPGYPITTLGMKILDAHVNEVEQAFILCDNAAPATTVTITSPA